MNRDKIKMNVYTKIFFSIIFAYCCTGTTLGAADWNIYLAVIAGGRTVPGEINPERGLVKISKDGKVIANMGYTNVTTFDAEVYPNNTKDLIYTANHNGLFVTKNNGEKWRVASDHKITEVQEVATDINNPAIVYIGTSYGLFKSTEYGEKFKKLTDRFVTALSVDNTKSNRIYVGQEDGLYISDDEGAKFNKVRKFDHYVNCITQEKNALNRIYVGSENDGIFISNNRGKTFTQCTGIAATDAVYSIVIDHNNPANIYTGTHENGVLISEDAGLNWKSHKSGIENCYAIYCIAINPDNAAVLYAGTTDGVFTSNDSGKSWTPFALPGAHVQHIFIK
jgi:photosystem II stability/assembly factor-like uncharacterized protein